MATPTDPFSLLKENSELLNDVQQWVQKLACAQDNPALLVPSLLGLIALRLAQLQSPFGSNYYRITPVNLTTDGQVIVDVQSDGLVRKVIIVVDNPSGGPAVTIRIGTSKGNTTNGGIRVNTGQSTELGEVHPQTKLWAAASSNICAYVIEYA